jgi:hypothetical protein
MSPGSTPARSLCGPDAPRGAALRLDTRLACVSPSRSPGPHRAKCSPVSRIGASIEFRCPLDRHSHIPPFPTRSPPSSLRSPPSSLRSPPVRHQANSSTRRPWPNNSGTPDRRAPFPRPTRPPPVATIAPVAVALGEQHVGGSGRAAGRDASGAGLGLDRRRARRGRGPRGSRRRRDLSRLHPGPPAARFRRVRRPRPVRLPAGLRLRPLSSRTSGHCSGARSGASAGPSSGSARPRRGMCWARTASRSTWLAKTSASRATLTFEAFTAERS